MNLLYRLAISAFALATLIMGAQANDLEDIKAAGKMRVAILQNYPPFGSVAPDMQPLGLDVDLGNAIGKMLGVQVEFIPVTSPNRIPYLQTGKVDIIIAALGKNAEREKVIDFTEGYAMIFNGVFGPPDIKVAGLEDLAGKTLAVTRGSTQDLQITELAPKTAIIKRFEDSAGSQTAYLSGQTDLFVTGNITAFFVTKGAGERPLETKFKISDEPIFIGIAKGEVELVAKVNELIVKLKQDGILAQMSEKWLGQAMVK